MIPRRAFHEGFSEWDPGVKLRDLEQASSPPAWYAELDPTHLTVINLIGNGPIHPSDGDVDRQKALDRQITAAVDALFTEILDLVYERPEKKKRLSLVQKAAEHLKQNGPPTAGDDATAEKLEGN